MELLQRWRASNWRTKHISRVKCVSRVHYSTGGTVLMAGLTAQLPHREVQLWARLAPRARVCQGGVTHEPAVRASEHRLEEGSSLAIWSTTPKVTLHVGCISECDSVFCFVFVCTKLQSSAYVSRGSKYSVKRKTTFSLLSMELLSTLSSFSHEKKKSIMDLQTLFSWCWLQPTHPEVNDTKSTDTVLILAWWKHTSPWPGLFGSGHIWICEDMHEVPETDGH